MEINENRSHYRYSKDEKKHIKRWGNAVLVLLLVAVLGAIYAYLRYDGLGINDLVRSNDSDTVLVNEPTSQPKNTAKYSFIEDLKSGSGSIFDQLPNNALESPDDNATVTNSNQPATSTNIEPVASAATNLPSATNQTPAPAMTNLDGANNNQNADVDSSSEPVTDNSALPPIVLNPPSSEPAVQPSPTSEPAPTPAPAAVVSTPVPEPRPDPRTPQPLTQQDLGTSISAQPAPSTQAPISSSNVGLAFQVGSFGNRSNAESMRANLGFLGIQSQVVSESGQFRVVTLRSNGAARQSIEQKLRSEGIDYFPRF